jgi:hypothetical protein
MLERLGRSAAPRERMKAAFQTHLEHLDRWLTKQPHIAIIRVSYNELINNPLDQAVRICEFLERILDIDAMIAAVDPTLYRNRGMSSGTGTQRNETV